MSKANIRTMVLCAMFIAMIALMAFTPLGYLRTGALEITFITIPVVIGAVALGPLGGAVLGGVFGVTSLIQCFGMSPFGAALLAINPLGCIVTCIVPRVLMGWLTGLSFKAVNSKKPGSLLAYSTASLVGPISNTVLFITSLMLFFGNSELISGLRGTLGLLPFIAAFVGINGLVEAIAGFVVCTAVCKALRYYFDRKNADKHPSPDGEHNKED